MQVAKPRTCKTAKKTMLSNKKRKLTLLSFHERLLNFNENIGISDTNSHENRQISASR